MSECVPWQGAIDRNGYGTLGRRYAHRLAYEAVHGEVPPGTEIDHACHSRDLSCPGGRTCPHRRCVNPDHLEAVTRRENIRRGRSFINDKADQTHCVNGHEFTEENTYRRPDTGCRVCRECRRINLRRLYARRRGVEA